MLLSRFQMLAEAFVGHGDQALVEPGLGDASLVAANRVMRTARGKASNSASKASWLITVHGMEMYNLTLMVRRHTYPGPRLTNLAR